MREQNFAYWLQGFFEIAKPESITADQVTTIKNHINLVKKCWEPIKEKPSNDGPDGGETGFDLPPLDDFLNVTTPSGETVLRC